MGGPGALRREGPVAIWLGRVGIEAEVGPVAPAEFEAGAARRVGYGPAALAAEREAGTDFETFFARAPRRNPARRAITGVVCGVRVEAIEEPPMREIRYLDKLVDELARGNRMEKILGEGR